MNTMARGRGSGGWLFLGLVLLAHAAAALLEPDIAAQARAAFVRMGRSVGPVLLLVFALVFLVERFLTPERTRAWLGRGSGRRGWLLALAAGVVSTGPVYAWYALLAGLRDKGMRDVLVAVALYARAIESGRARLLTILLAPLVPCGARLLVLAFLTPVFFGAHALVVAMAFVAANLGVLALAGRLLNRQMVRGERVFFIMEIALYHAPNAPAIARFVWQHVGAFLRRAGSLIVAFSVALWALGHFPGPGLEHSALAAFGRWLAPLGEWLGLDWRLLVALLSSFVAKENAIAALGVLYAAASEESLAATLAASVSPASALSFLAATMLFIPCVATVAVMRKETGSWRWTLLGVGLLLVIALAGAGLVYQICRLLGFGLL